MMHDYHHLMFIIYNFVSQPINKSIFALPHIAMQKSICQKYVQMLVSRTSTTNKYTNVLIQLTKNCDPASCHPKLISRPIAMRMMVMRPKKMMVWMRMDTPLVCMLLNSITRLLPGNWNNRPGDRITNRNTPTKTGAQSAIVNLKGFLGRTKGVELYSLWIWGLIRKLRFWSCQGSA